MAQGNVRKTYRLKKIFTASTSATAMHLRIDNQLQLPLQIDYRSRSGPGVLLTGLYQLRVAIKDRPALRGDAYGTRLREPQCGLTERKLTGAAQPGPALPK